MTITQTKSDQQMHHVLDAIRVRQRFVVASHARPDGDATGSQLALAYALRHLSREVLVISRDPPPPYLQSFSRISDVKIASSVDGEYDAAIVLECGSLNRTEVSGLDRYFLINIDHHLGNTMYGALNWFDETAAACGEMVFEIVRGLGVPLTPEIASLLYVTILTDTGSFRHSNITARTFEICRQIAKAGVIPAMVSDRVYQSGGLGKLRLTGALLDRMELVGNGRVAVLHIDTQILQETGGSADDMEGLVNIPLEALDVQAVVLFKQLDDTFRVSLRSKGTIDVRTVATAHGGGGHRNASGFSVSSPLDKARQKVIENVVAAVDAGTHS